jgi:hypothetical protein
MVDLADLPPDYIHPAFPQPPNPNAKVWRYIDAMKFRHLVSTNSLYMPRTDCLGDEFEGSTPAAEVAEWALRAKQETDLDKRNAILGQREQLRELAETFLRNYYVSCWHMAEDENIAMWERYVKTPESVAIFTTYANLREEVKPRQVVELGMVRYIDYDVQSLPSLNMLQRIMHKRHFFADEREVRAVVCRILPEGIGKEYVEPFLNDDASGFLQPISARKLITGVVFNPKASIDFQNQIAIICKDAGLPIPQPSRIAQVPRY